MSIALSKGPKQEIACTEFDRDFKTWERLQAAPAWVFPRLRELPFEKFVEANRKMVREGRADEYLIESTNGVREFDRWRMLQQLDAFFIHKDLSR